MQGWISLNRELMEHWLWQKKPFSYGQAWVHILLSCNHSDTKVLIEKELIKCNRGQSVKSIKTWSNDFGWSTQKTKTFFNLLKSDAMINTEGLRKTTRLTVCNYNRYQDNQPADNSQNNQQLTSKQPATNSQLTTNNNDNNENTVNNENKKDVQKKSKPSKHKHGQYKHVLLTEDEYQRLSDEWGIEVLLHEIKNMDEGIEMKGYKYKNHNLALRKWHKNEHGKNTETVEEEYQRKYGGLND